MALFRRNYERHVAAVILLYLLGVLVYSNTFTSPFVFDDYPNIRDNVSIRLTSLTADGLFQAAFESVSDNRPIANISFALNYRFGGYDVRGYHLVNLFVHVANAALVYLLALKLLPRLASQPPSSDARLRWAALAAAAIFLVHPVQTQAVTYVVQRMTSLATLFFLVTLLLFVVGREAAGARRAVAWLSAIGAALLALGTKEIAAVLPLTVVLVEGCCFRDERRSGFKFTALLTAAALVVVALIGWLYMDMQAGEFLDGQYVRREFGPLERIMTELRVLFFYATLVLYPDPSRFNLLHAFALSTGWLSPVTTLLSFIGVLASLIVAALAARRLPVVTFCILWLALTSAIESSFVGLEIIFEHRLYLPMVAIGLGAGYACLVWSSRSVVVWVGLIGMLAFLSAGAYLRNSTWSDRLTLWVDVVSKNPQSARARNNLGRALLEQGERDEAIVQLNQAIFLDPDYAEPYNNLGVVHVAESQFGLAIDSFTRAMKLEPRAAQTRHNLGLALYQTGRSADAIAQLRTAIELDPTYARAHISLATVLADSGEPERACDHLRAAERYVPAEKLAEALAYCDP